MTEPANGPVAAPVAPLAVRRPVQAMSRKSFQTVDKLKGYLRDVPELHAKLVTVINALDATAKALSSVTRDVERVVRQWEEEQKHGSPAPAAAPGVAPVVAAPVGAAAPVAHDGEPAPAAPAPGLSA